jgi:Icc protein
MTTAITQEQIQLIEPADASVLRLAQITDCHIFASADTCLQGLNTRQSFELVSKAIHGNSANLDLLLATGDLSQDESAASYKYLAHCFDELDIATFWLPGNHDKADTMRQHLRGKKVFAQKRVLAGAWQIVLLDSTIEGEVYGRVAEDQLQFLDDALQAFPDQHALVCLHHQAIDCGCTWLDLKGLKDNQQLRHRILQHDNVRGVLWGHVHQEAHHHIDGVEWMSSPSSCIQFKPGSVEFALGAELPGFRELKLYPDGRIESTVHRLGADEYDQIQSRQE